MSAATNKYVFAFFFHDGTNCCPIYLIVVNVISSVSNYFVEPISDYPLLKVSFTICDLKTVIYFLKTTNVI